jgi:hypothetical protein
MNQQRSNDEELQSVSPMQARDKVLGVANQNSRWQAFVPAR